MRSVLGELNKAIADPQRREPGHHGRFFLIAPEFRDRKGAFQEVGLPWKDEYAGEEGDVPFLKALRDAQIRRVDRVKYVLANRAEIEQQKATIDQQIAYRTN